MHAYTTQGRKGRHEFLDKWRMGKGFSSTANSLHTHTWGVNLAPCLGYARYARLLLHVRNLQV